MKFTIPKLELQKGLTRIQAIVEKRSSMPILANVLLEAKTLKKQPLLELSATDLEVGIRGTHAIEIHEAGAITTPAKKLYEIVRELPDEPVHIEATENQYLNIRCARAKFVLAGSSSEEYPSLPEFSPGKTTHLQAAILSTMIERTMYATSLDETRYNLNGVYLELAEDGEHLRMVATDGHRLATAQRAVGTGLEGLGEGVIVPRKALSELKRLVDEDDADEVELAFEGNNGLARKGGVTLMMRLIDGEFPNYRQVLPKEISHTLTVGADSLIHVIRRVALLSTERGRTVKFEFTAGQLAVSSNNPDLGQAEEELDVDYAGEALTVAFNARYVLEALSAFHAKEIQLGLQNSASPMQIRPTNDEETFAIIMPMRL